MRVPEGAILEVSLSKVVLSPCGLGHLEGCIPLLFCILEVLGHPDFLPGKVVNSYYLRVQLTELLLQPIDLDMLLGQFPIQLQCVLISGTLTVCQCHCSRSCL
ncbi:hypothetical protein LIER_31716 [Lithospermum erythrorhizon]|uniref:Uncharacterized protein n=1 Tax=Lithospermum erythrorhizon TaxID=34254 RepID=A0AAV3RRT5_LITER